MPELPDVEGFRKYFEETSLNREIIKTELSASKMLKETDPGEFKKFTEGYKFTSTYRHGKYMFAGLNNKKYLMLHFGMTGYLIYYRNEEDADSHIRLQFKLNNGFYIAYSNLRKFGAIMLIDSIDEFIKKKSLGADPINENLSYNKFKRLIEGKSGTVKALLMDQTKLAGIGNLYSDEIAYQSGIHPSAVYSSLDEDRKKTLFRKMMSILKAAVNKDGDSSALPGKYLLNHRKESDECPLCGGKITHKTIAGRTSYFCKSHQKL